MTDYGPPRVLDASAIVELFRGHPLLMQLLDAADAGRVQIGLPSTSIAEAQAVLDVAPSMWHHWFRFPGLNELPLGAHGALEVGRLARPRTVNPVPTSELTNPLQIGHVLYEAYAMRAVIVTAIPAAYGGHDLVVHPLHPPLGGGPVRPV